MKRTGIALLALVALAGCGAPHQTRGSALLDQQIAACQSAWDAGQDSDACTDKVAQLVLDRAQAGLSDRCKNAINNPGHFRDPAEDLEHITAACGYSR